MRAETGDCPSCLRQHAEQRAAPAVPSIQIAHSVEGLTVGLWPSLYSRTRAGEAPGVWCGAGLAPLPNPEPVVPAPLLGESRRDWGLVLEEPGRLQSIGSPRVGHD